MGVKTLPSAGVSPLDSPAAAAATLPAYRHSPRASLPARLSEKKVKPLASPPSPPPKYPSSHTSPLDTPTDVAAATTLSPYRHSRPGASWGKAPLKDPADALDVSSTAAADIEAATTISPFKSANDGADIVVEASNALSKVSRRGHGAGSGNNDAAGAVNVTEAMSFLDMMRSKAKEGVYRQFLDILGDYRQGKCRPIEVSKRVTLLFHRNQHKDLAEEMYKWTPLQHRYYMPFASCTR